jgi:ABC-type multidrug transport system fused ATPase/permease subunit
LSAGQLAAFVMYSLILAGNITGLSSAYLDLSKTLAAMDRLMQIIDCAPSTTTTKTTTMPNNNSIPPPMIAKQQHLPRRRQKKHRNGWSILPMFDRQPHPPMHRPWFNDDDEDHDDDYRRSHHGGENDVTTTRGGPISASFRDVSFAYPSRPNVTVLHDFSLDIAAGQTVAIVGASGAGKSTVAALLTRLYDKNTPTTNGNGGGHIYLDGVDISTLSPHDVRERVGVVSQEPTLFPNMTIADNIRYGTFHSVTDRDVYEAAVAAHVWDFCQHLPDGLQTLVGPTQLSGGQKQRVAIARCLLKKSYSLVILDEATSALDAESEHAVQQALEAACMGRTVLVIAHRLSSIQRADQIAMLEAGRLVETGTYHDLVNKPNGHFRRLVERQLHDDRRVIK